MAIVSGGMLALPKSNNLAGITPAIAPSMPIYGDPSTFGTADTKQTANYDDIMSGYKNLAPTSPDINAATSNLSQLALTGGFSPQDLTDIRARAANPIRSIYSSAQENLDRSKALGGGYSPGYAAANAKMARDLSSQLSGNLSSTNADIAENTVRNRLTAAPMYSTAATGEMERQAGLLDRQRSLYGTTPALTDMFGRQVASAAGLGQSQQQINNQRESNLLNIGSRFFG
jgi:hypothetical protein